MSDSLSAILAERIGKSDTHRVRRGTSFVSTSGLYPAARMAAPPVHVAKPASILRELLPSGQAIIAAIRIFALCLFFVRAISASHTPFDRSAVHGGRSGRR